MKSPSRQQKFKKQSRQNNKSAGIDELRTEPLNGPIEISKEIAETGKESGEKPKEITLGILIRYKNQEKNTRSMLKSKTYNITINTKKNTYLRSAW